jgi:DNA (cytosine-5)-methyltransferase 1
MIYGSVCSGIEAATVAWHGLGWKPSFFSEIEKFPRDVLAHHYPNTPLHGDFTTIEKDDYEPIELLVGGTPCQSFSVAGLREGLNDPRGNLMLEFGALANRLQPKWLVWENVPGVLSSNDGKDFGSFLAMLAELGYGFAYRVLDAQHFGVPQRRRRVFVIGCFGDWRSAAAVLFERDSLQGNPPPSREKRKVITGSIAFGVGEREEIGHCLRSGASRADKHESTTYIATFDRQSSGEYGDASVASTMSARDYKSPSDLVTYALAGNTIGRQPENGGNGTGYDDSGVSYTLTKTDQHAVAYAFDSLASNSMKSSNPLSGCNQVDISKTIDTSGLNPACNQGGNAVMQNMQVRRLTPVECERLQGFPDNYTNIPGASDSPRYKALGNSMAVPVMKWLGERIQMVELMA